MQRPTRERPPTIHDVAHRAGVSKSLVSLVLRGSPSVSLSRREAVERAVAELGYRPNLIARSLVRRRTKVLGVILPDLHNPFFAEVVDGIRERAAEAGYRTLIGNGTLASRGREEAEAIEMMLELRADGLILVGPQIDTRAIVAASAALPVVLVTRATRARSVDSVVNDDRLGATLAVEHLAALGHGRIAHIDGGGAPGAEPRRRAYLRTMGRLGLAAHARIAGGVFSEEGGARGVRSLLAAGDAPTAIFVADDIAALGALSEMTGRGLRVPDDVSLVGYDNTSLAALRAIDLTTVDQPRFQMGAAAVAILLERLAGDRTEPTRIVRAPTLVVRGTTGPPPARPA